MGFYDSHFDFNGDGILDEYEEACEDYNYDELFGDCDEHSGSYKVSSGGTVTTPSFRKMCESYGINPGKTSKEHWQAFDEVLKKVGEGLEELKKKTNDNSDNVSQEKISAASELINEVLEDEKHNGIEFYNEILKKWGML